MPFHEWTKKYIYTLVLKSKIFLPDGESNPGLSRSDQTLLTGEDTDHYTIEDW